ncbi:MAG: radical SAM protein [Myxococcales bacterium]|nr:radical SAM protein [Myxococcales bacterium]
MRWLEISPGFSCNCRCIGCHSCSPAASDQMPTEDVLRWLQSGRRSGARHLWLSGGEPTLRKDFLQMLRAARHLGYERIKVQSNGMLFAYPEFAARAVQAGMTEVNLLLKSLDPKVHDGLNRTPGSHAALTRGLDVLRPLPVRLEGDFLMTTRNWQELPAIVAHYAELGLVHFNIWLFSLVDQGDADLRRLVPRLSECRPAMLEALAVAKAHGVTLCSLNTPHCTLPPEAWEMQFDSAGMELLVVNPGGRAFMLETSSIEQGTFVAACEGCAVRTFCHGMRSDYIAVYGDGELRAVRPDELAGFEPRGSVLDIGPVGRAPPAGAR